MSRMLVESPGLFTTVQDLGRQGFGPLGVSPSGAADSVALRVGNLLLGNSASAAALEMTLTGGVFGFPDGAVLALTGADFGATLDDVPVEQWQVIHAAPGQTLRLDRTRGGARCYLCVAGGFVVDKFLGSSSTHILSGLGGLNGRALKRGDALEIGVCAAPVRDSRIRPDALAQLQPRKVLRVTKGPQADWFDEDARGAFYCASYSVTEEANRMGLRLEGPRIPLARKRSMLTEGAPLGAVQVPESGQPLILFVEQQTTGGYPKIANVITADMSSVGQLRPRDEVQFELVSFETAKKLAMEQERLLSSGDLIEELG
ncbi:MAG TPA: biotin-dependent carboxyltransferase family protein, partial [Terracidiphilus sp.]|nr:biotin-dependent carboxyltransferase family protein [Terracidiphilus sp.]